MFPGCVGKQQAGCWNVPIRRIVNPKGSGGRGQGHWFQGQLFLYFYTSPLLAFFSPTSSSTPFSFSHNFLIEPDFIPSLAPLFCERCGQSMVKEEYFPSNHWTFLACGWPMIDALAYPGPPPLCPSVAILTCSRFVWLPLVDILFRRQDNCIVSLNSRMAV